MARRVMIDDIAHFVYLSIFSFALTPFYINFHQAPSLSYSVTMPLKQIPAHEVFVNHPRLSPVYHSRLSFPFVTRAFLQFSLLSLIQLQFLIE